MPNQNSKAGHQAERTCVVCREKSVQKALLGFFFLDGRLVFDLRGHCQARKFYLCPSGTCVAGLPKWRQRYQKKRGALLNREAGK